MTIFSRFKTVLLLAFVLLCLVLGYLVIEVEDDTAPLPPQAQASVQLKHQALSEAATLEQPLNFYLSFAPAEPISFTFAVHSTGLVNTAAIQAAAFQQSAATTAATMEPLGMDFSGTLFMALYPAENSGWQVAGRIKPDLLLLNQLAPIFMPHMETPFAFRLSAQGVISHFVFPENLHNDAEHVIRQLVHYLQLPLPRSARSEWTTTEFDTMGKYQGAYRLVQLTLEQLAVVQKTKTGYAELHSPYLFEQGGRTDAWLGDNQAFYELSAKGAWIQRVEGQEQLSSTLGALPLSEMHSYYRLIRGHDQPAIPFPAHFADFLQLIAKTVLSTLQEAISAELLLMVDGLSADDFLLLYQSVFAENPQVARELLIAFLTHHPEASADLVEVLDSISGMTEQQELMVWHALAYVGGRAHQMALLKAAASGRMESTRTRALAHSHGVQAPVQDFVDGLLGIYHGRDSYIADMALLTVGSLGDQSRDTSDMTTNIGDYLVSMLYSANSHDDQALILSALYNTADAGALTAVEGFLQHEAESVRAAAFETIAAMDTSDSFASFARAFQGEASDEVRQVALQSVQDMQQAEQRNAWLLSQLQQAELADPQQLSVNMALIRAIGNSAADLSAAEEALRQRLFWDIPAELKQEILRHVSP
ncbi:HEAT repeat domain-containing protein [Alkalimonas delamerensis]|uniref:HEAT repeat domain-containing protein n=1 Tax=Alkalimonas delamerensis TaxID=265981 RepID=A0ABT9GPZ7_9GAMM|nr:HEAT repeat domain-containing protein [Alkalimonas delamerensis]MDP4529050.1 HEAT repeat domain-containing protein [Alkalimonas delamerensis]